MRTLKGYLLFKGYPATVSSLLIEDLFRGCHLAYKGAPATIGVIGGEGWLYVAERFLEIPRDIFDETVVFDPKDLSELNDYVRKVFDAAGRKQQERIAEDQRKAKVERDQSTMRQAKLAVIAGACLLAGLVASVSIDSMAKPKGRGK